MSDFAAYLPFACVILIAIGMLALITLSVLSTQRKQNARSARLLETGFTAVTRPDAVLEERIQALRPRKSQQRIVAKHIYQKRIAWGTAYLFDLEDESGQKNSTAFLRENLIAIISPDLALPYFQVMPQIDLEGQDAGLAARAAERVYQWAITQSRLPRIHFSNHSTFDRRFVVLAKDEQGTRQFLNDTRLNGLLGLPRTFQLDAGGDCLIVTPSLLSVAQTAAQKSDVVDPNLLLGDALAILNLFR